VSREPSQEQKGSGPAQGVLVDVGFDAGALIVYADAACLGREVWLSRRGELTRIHVEILERSTRAEHVYAAVFPSLRGGEYEIWVGNANPAAEVTIVAGEVLEVRPCASWE
jgi:hypothetical protein